ncbi:MAG TPA: penicillin-binding protein 2 [Actinomycetota bacterium]|nr:penicillin-binding protein 2 [Actinomycetota bacterium]
MPQAKGSGRKRPPARRPPPRRRPPLKRRRRRVSGRRRLLALLILSILAFGAISGRLIVLQVFDAGSLDQAAARQRLTVIELPAMRGRIFDRNLSDLAISIPARSVWADPRLVRNRRHTAAKLAGVLGMSKKRLAQRLASKGRFVYLVRRIPKSRGDMVQRLNLPGVFVEGAVARRYPSGTVAAQVLGFVDVEGHGQAGIEQHYDGLLRGQPGKVQLERDPQGRAIPQGRRSLEPAEPGTDLVLTIDQHLQYVTEQALYRAVRQHKAKAGSVVVMSPRTGEVLAMANMPTFDPNRIAASRAESRKNRAIADMFEPGSTNKTITAAAALQHGIVTPKTETIVPDNLPLCPEKTFRDSHSHAPELMTFADIVAKSSNVGTIMAARDLGRDRLYQTQVDFGYGRRSGVDLPGESPGILRPAKDWYCTDLGTNAIGQGVAVTVLQMASVYATVANDGVLRAPTLLRGTVDARGTVAKAERRPGRRVLSTKTARSMSRILEGVVKEGGTGTQAAMEEWRVAGKTGTARKPDTVRGGYRPGAYVGSFIGFAPAEKPAVVVAVVIDEPTRGYYGGSVAAPVFREVTGTALRRLGVVPTLPAKAVR